MIQLMRLNSKPLVVNSDLIKFVEGAPDTVLTLITGEKMVVRETIAQVIERIVEFRRAVLAGLPSAGANLHLANSMQRGKDEFDEDDPGDSGVSGVSGG